jgi:hypothetical protein
MIYRWSRKNIDLSRLQKDIRRFLEGRGFKIKNSDSTNHHEYELFGVLRTVESDFRSVRITIDKTSDGFEVELKAGEQAKAILKLSSFISFLGGGSLLLKGYKSTEFYQELEDEFWRYVEKKVEEQRLREAGATSSSSTLD